MQQSITFLQLLNIFLLVGLLFSVISFVKIGSTLKEIEKIEAPDQSSKKVQEDASELVKKSAYFLLFIILLLLSGIVCSMIYQTFIGQ